MIRSSKLALSSLVELHGRVSGFGLRLASVLTTGRANQATRL